MLRALFRWLFPTHHENVNCLTCGTGSRWWFDGRCITCDGDPNVAGSGRPDWDDWDRAKFVRLFGPRQQGDIELMNRYYPDGITPAATSPHG